MEIYCITTSIFLADYEKTQAAIFEYIYAMARHFELQIYQHPAGSDFARLAQPRPDSRDAQQSSGQ